MIYQGKKKLKTYLEPKKFPNIYSQIFASLLFILPQLYSPKNLRLNMFSTLRSRIKKGGLSIFFLFFTLWVVVNFFRPSNLKKNTYIHHFDSQLTFNAKKILAPPPPSYSGPESNLTIFYYSRCISITAIFSLYSLLKLNKTILAITKKKSKFNQTPKIYSQI